MFKESLSHEVLIPKEEIPSLENLIKNPKIIFDTDVEVNASRAYQSHRTIRNALSNKANYLGIGSVGYVFSSTSAEYGERCNKIVWDRLLVKPNKGLPIEDLKNYGDEIERLYQIQESFSYTREAINNLRNENRVTLSNNEPILEASLQVFARNLLLSRGIKCVVPETQDVFTYDCEDQEHDYNDYSYFLDEKYTVITMEQIRGKSIQDLIEEYPENIDSLKDFDFDTFRNELVRAIEAINSMGLMHGDISPRNIMINFDNMMPTLIDFGKSDLISSGQESYDLDCLRQVLDHLRFYLKNPKRKHDEFIKLKKERERKAGFIFG